LVLVPTTDLTIQVRDIFLDLTYYCSHLISVLYIASDITIQAQKPRLAELPDILVATPGRLVQHIEEKNVDITKLKMIIIDEADLTLSYGYVTDIEKIKNYLPRICQGFLMSATLSPEIQSLKQLVLHTPTILEMEEERLDDDLLLQYTIDCKENDKFLIIYALFSLKLLKGKTIAFVNNIDKCYRLKLFLERFSIRSAVLNSELPQNSRFHIVEEFNRGVFDILIATDENQIQDDFDENEEPQNKESIKITNENTDNIVSDNISEIPADQNSEDSDPVISNPDVEIDDNNEENINDDNEENINDDNNEDNNDNEVEMNDIPTVKNRKNQKGKRKQDKEYGVSRGIDFRNVSNVVNFDFPHTVKNYVHRVGRTARAGNYGTSLSFITDYDHMLLDKVKIYMEKKKKSVNPYKFKMSVVESFRYRVEDMLKSVTSLSIKSAKLQELKSEILNSKKLKMHFEENPQDLKFFKTR